MSDFVQGYIECALWASHDTTEDGEEIRMEDYKLSESAKTTLTEQALAFENANSELIDECVARGWHRDCAGHDYWLTRNRHGAGFWGRGLGELGDKLTALAHAEGECNLYLGDDNLIYVS